MDKVYQGFEGLELYKAARIFRQNISLLTKGFPKSEEYSLKSQIVRSSRSITANIAEGYGRYHYQEFIQFCRHAKGSLLERLEHLICASDEQYLNEEQLNEFRAHFNHLLRLLNGFIAYLQKQNGAISSNINVRSLPNTTNTTITSNTTI